MRLERLAILALVASAGCAKREPVVVPAAVAVLPPQAGSYVAVVDAHSLVSDGSTVGGTPTFHTIAAALASLTPEAEAQRVVLVRAGRYREKLIVDRGHVTLRGEKRETTVITFDASAGAVQPGGGTYGTSGSFTMRIAAPDFRAEHLTIENAFDFQGNSKLPDTSAVKIRSAQAVALQLDRGSDRAAFLDCVITGWQDTLYANAGRAWFYHCVIEGNTDFIFGAGIAVFEECDIVSRAAGFITAPSTPPLQAYGFVFVASKLSRTANVKEQTVALGRPWHPSSNPNVNPSAVYIDCLMDDHITIEGWTSMGGYEPGTARFFEYGSKGPGAIKHAARRRLTDADVLSYSIDHVLSGWEPAR